MWRYLSKYCIPNNIIRIKCKNVQSLQTWAQCQRYACAMSVGCIPRQKTEAVQTVYEGEERWEEVVEGSEVEKQKNTKKRGKKGLIRK